MCAASSPWGWTISKNDRARARTKRKAGTYYEKDLQDRSGLRQLRPEDGGCRQHRSRCGKGDRQLYDPEDEGGVRRGCRPSRHHGERAVCLQEGRGRLRDL